MNFAKDDFRRLRWPIAGAALLITAGLACVATAEYYLGKTKAKRGAVQTQLATARDRIAKSSEEEKQIRINLSQYDKMVASGIVGQQDRLDLVDKIAEIKSGRRLYDIKYNIGSQRAVDYPGIVPSGTLDFVNSPMLIDMAILHEEDLLNFLNDIRATRRMHVIVRNCSLQRTGVSSVSGPLTPTMKANCALDLINLVPVKAS